MRNRAFCQIQSDVLLGARRSAVDMIVDNLLDVGTALFRIGNAGDGAVIADVDGGETIIDQASN